MTHPSLTLVVPAYNEAESLERTLPELIDDCRQRGWSLVVVNDGSNDDSRTILDKWAGSDGLHVLRHKVNRGYGGALKTGIRHAGTELIATMDADGQHRLIDIDGMLDTMRRTDADMVVGNRGRDGGWSPYRRAGRWIIRTLTRILLPHNIRDINSGMKLCRADLAKRYIALLPDGMAFSDTFLLIFLHQRRRVVEHSIRVNQRKLGRSSITTHSAFETVLQILHIVVLFHPMRLFLPLALLAGGAGLIWGLPFLLAGLGLSAGSMLGLVTALMLFMLGLLAEQLAMLRKQSLLDDEAGSDKGVSSHPS